MPERVPMLALSVLPRKDSLVVIVSFFRTDASVYGPLVESVFSMSDERFLQVISYWAVTYAENWAVSPSLVSSWPAAKRKEIESWFDETIAFGLI